MKPVLPAVCIICVSLVLRSPVVAQKGRTVEVPKEIVQQLIKDQELKEFIQLRPDGSAENLVAEPLDLDRDGKPELEVHGIGPGICGAANCVTWIYRKAANEYQMLLDAGSIQRVEPQNTFTKDYRDIITSMHGSAWDSDLTLYKFDGKQYQRVGCFFRTYRYKDKRGNYRESKLPIITRAKCELEQ
jgi:hypothetical protein